MFEEKLEIRSSHCDTFGRLKPSELFLIFQDLATKAAETNNVGRKEVLDKGYLWVFTRIEVEIMRYPDYWEHVDLSTYPGKTRAFFYPRHAFVRDGNGDLIARVASVWAIINEKTREIRMDPLPITGVESHPEIELPLPPKLEMIEDPHLLYSRRIGYSDLDLNHHMNNVKYVEILLDAYSSEEYASRPLKKITINYLHEIKEGETLDLYSDSKRELFEGKIGDRVAFVAKLEF